MRREITAVIAAVVLAFIAVQIPNLPILVWATTLSGYGAVPSEAQPITVPQAKAERTQDVGAAAQAWEGALALILVFPLMLAVACYLVVRRAV